MKLLKVNGATSAIFRVFLENINTGQGLEGLSDGSDSLVISTIADNEATATAYTQAGSTIETIATLGTYAAPTSTKCRFKEVDATNHPGIYELQLANARLAVSGAKSLLVSITGAANLRPMNAEIQLTGVDVDDSAAMGIKLLKADWAIDTGTTPWQLVAIERGTGALGTGTELFRWNIKDTSNANLTAITTVPGRFIAP